MPRGAGSVSFKLLISKQKEVDFESTSYWVGIQFCGRDSPLIHQEVDLWVNLFSFV